MNEDFDFGFTAVDEDELDAVQQLTQATTTASDQVNRLEEKVDKLYNAIIPLLSNLKKNPERDYIKWPNRLEKIEQYEQMLEKIISS